MRKNEYNSLSSFVSNLVQIREEFMQNGTNTVKWIKYAAARNRRCVLGGYSINSIYRGVMEMLGM